MAKTADLSKNDQNQQAEAEYKFWSGQLDAYHKQFGSWEKRTDKIVERYRLESSEATYEDDKRLPKYNILYANISILQPAIYNQTPTALAERRDSDNDPIGRLASMMLQRALNTQMELIDFDAAMEQSRDDNLFSGRGVVWNRYEKDDGAPLQSNDDNQPGLKEFKGERVCLDYVFYKDFAHAPVKKWKDVWWVGRKLQLTEDEAIDFLGEELAHKLKYQDPDGVEVENTADETQDSRKGKVAYVWEIWDRKAKKIRFLSREVKGRLLKTRDYPYHINGGFPCPKPVYGITTNNSLKPVPDYAMYQDQALELDDLTGRISMLTRACKAAGIADKKIAVQVQALLQSDELEVTPVDDLASKYAAAGGGMSAYLQFFPVEQFANTISVLQPQKDQCKRDIDEITGISDILRGYSAPDATATAEQIKNNYATLRLRKKQRAFQTFARDAIRIMAEIMCEQFQPQTLIDLSNIMQLGPQPPSNKQMMIPAPVNPQQPPMPNMPPQMIPNPEMMAYLERKKAWDAMVAEAIDLLANDKQRTLRIDIETDSTIGLIEQQDKQDTMQFTSTVAGLLQQAIPAIQQTPALAPFIKETLMLTIRQFKIGRQTEASFEESLDKLVAQAQQPKQPQENPDAAKSAADLQKAQLDAQTRLKVVEMQQAGETARQQSENQLDAAKLNQERNAKIADLLLRKQELEARQLATVANGSMALSRPRFDQRGF